jgi:hypothetical protein
MQFGNNSTNVSFGNRSALILIVILTVLIIVLLGVLYFVKQRSMGEDSSGSLTANPKTQADTHNIKELRDLTTAPENNPDIKPNPALTALTSVPENNNYAKADSKLMENLNAPKK